MITRAEFDTVKTFKYKDYCEYLVAKHGKVLYTYGSIKNKKLGLFIHHIKEDTIPSLSHPAQRRIYPDFQEPEYLCYCDYLEHLLLHIMIGKETLPGEHLGLGGPYRYIVPALLNFYEHGLTHPKWNSAFYEGLIESKDIFDELFNEYNKLVINHDHIENHNITLYKQIEDSLNTKGRACAVLGCNLGKTTLTLEYLKNYNFRALVIGPQDIIVENWSKYKACDPDDIDDDIPDGWVEPITIQTFSKKYKKIDYSLYDIIVIDEAHHIGYDEITETGAMLWGKAIDYLNNINIKVLGLTATPERTDGIDISDTFFKDCTFEGLDISDAIKQGILHCPSYITSVYDKDVLREELTKSSANITDPVHLKLIGQLTTDIDQIPGVVQVLTNPDHPITMQDKGIIFVQALDNQTSQLTHNVVDIAWAADILKQALPGLKYGVTDDPTNTEFDIRPLHSDLTKAQNKVTMNWFDNTDRGWVIVRDMMTEGFHPRNISVEIMFRSTNSYVLLVQQIGRGLTLSKFTNPHARIYDFVNNINKVQFGHRKKSLGKTRNTSFNSVIKKMAQASDQIICTSYVQDTIERLKALKDYTNDSWEDWEIQILKDYYETEGAVGCQRRIDEEWERRYPGSLTT